MDVIFGDINKFAVELRLSHNPENVWMIGYVYFYIKGSKIGDLYFTTSLRDVMIDLQGLCMMPEKRIYKNFFQKDYYEIFSLIREALQEEICSGNDGFFGEHYGFYPGEFILFPRVNVLDEWPTYMVSSGEFDKVVCKDKKNNLFYCGIFKRGVVDSVMKEALLYLETIHSSMLEENS